MSDPTDLKCNEVKNALFNNLCLPKPKKELGNICLMFSIRYFIYKDQLSTIDKSYELSENFGTVRLFFINSRYKMKHSLRFQWLLCSVLKHDVLYVCILYKISVIIHLGSSGHQKGLKSNF